MKDVASLPCAVLPGGCAGAGLAEGSGPGRERAETCLERGAVGGTPTQAALVRADWRADISVRRAINA